MSSSRACSSDGAVELSRGSEVLWDEQGVPHIYAQRADSVAYAFGRAQMQMHPELLLRMYAQARGRGAEFYGRVFAAGEPFPSDMLEVDKLVRTMGFPGRAKQWLQQQSPRMRAYIESFISGVNDQAAALTLSLSARAVLPARSEDVLAHTLRIFFAYLTGPTMTGAANCSMIYPNDLTTPFNLIGGSNGWALGAQKTESGHAMLLANPHLLWGGTHTWFEAHISSPEYDIYGATLVGLPVVRIGYNDRLGWTHTVNSQDGCDLYQLQRSGAQYVLDGVAKDFDSSQETVMIRQPNGTLQSQPLLIRRSVHGPIFEKGGKTYALRVVGIDQLQTPGVLEQWWEMAQAKDFNAFRDIVGQLRNPFHNIVYADAAKNVWLLFGGLTPRRAQGDAAFWAQPVDGSRSDLLWIDALRMDELPQLANPACGWVQNSNSVPWFMSRPALEPANYAAYLSPLAAPLLREQRGIQLIEQTPKFTLESLLAAKHDTRSLLADRVLDDLITYARASGDASLRRAGQVLSDWDRRSDANSKGAVLFAGWVAVSDGEESLRYRQEPDFTLPYASPAGLRDLEQALARLAEAVHVLEQAKLPLDVEFGAVYRLRRGVASSPHYVDEPANGADESLGGFRTFSYADDRDGRQRAVFGDTFTALVEFSQPVRAKVINTYGNSSNPSSPHYGDQLSMAARSTMRDALLTREQVERGTVRRESFGR